MKEHPSFLPSPQPPFLDLRQVQRVILPAPERVVEPHTLVRFERRDLLEQGRYLELHLPRLSDLVHVSEGECLRVPDVLPKGALPRTSPTSAVVGLRLDHLPAPVQEVALIEAHAHPSDHSDVDDALDVARLLAKQLRIRGEVAPVLGVDVALRIGIGHLREEGDELFVGLRPTDDATDLSVATLDRVATATAGDPELPVAHPKHMEIGFSAHENLNLSVTRSTRRGTCLSDRL